jgi:hypothetical protein
MDWPNGLNCVLPFTPSSSVEAGFHIYAALGGGQPHLFEVDTGSVGILVPRKALGPAYQDFDPFDDIKFRYVSSGKVYWGQWVRVPVVLGVPPDWDGTGDFPSTEIEVFAADQPADFDGGILGIGFAIGGLADGGSARNPLLHLTYLGDELSGGYIVTSQGLNAGLTAHNTNGFSIVSLERNASDSDWQQPIGSLDLPGDFSIDLPVLIDTGLAEMLLWLEASKRPPALASVSELPPGVAVSIAVPPASSTAQLALNYSFTTRDPTEPMAPSMVAWRDGNGINTGRNVLAGVDYLYDATGGHGVPSTCAIR